MAILVATLALIIIACGGDTPAALTGIVREPAPNVGDVVLPDVTNGGQDFATRAEPGRLLLVYFGYTSCPDICPTTMADLRAAVRGLEADADRIDVAFITVDPDRDLPERVADYVHAFFDEGLALRTDDDAQLEAAAERYGASFEVAAATDGSIEVAHSAFLYAVDSDGYIRVQWPFGAEPEDMQRDMELLLARGVA